MKQFGKILKFELMSYFKNKVFVGVTILLVAVIAGVMCFPRIMSAFESGDAEEMNEAKPVMLVSGESAEQVQTVFAEAFPEYDVQVSQNDLGGIQETILSGDVECAFVMDSETEYTYYVNNLEMYDMNTDTANEALQNLYQVSAMLDSGMTEDQVADALNVQISAEVTSLGKDQMQNYFYTYIMIFALYMVIMLYGQMVATNVATEKSSRAMELLITSAKPTSMMFGKVLASCLAGMIQIVAVFGAAFLFYNLNQSYWEDNMTVTSIFNIPLELLGYMLVFFVLGFLIYAFLYGAIGSTASKLEDINTSVLPLNFLFIFAFMVVVFSMSSGTVDNLLMRICSYVPFTSPMAMFTRIAMSTVAWYEIAVSIGILIVSMVGIGILSAKIYRVGVLLYGTTPRIGAIIKAIRKA